MAHGSVGEGLLAEGLALSTPAGEWRGRTGSRRRRNRTGPPAPRGLHDQPDHRATGQPAWGLAGGESGAPGENWLLRAGDESVAERLPDRCTIRLQAGDVLRMRTPPGPRSSRRVLEVIEDRVGLRSTIVTSQLPVAMWHEALGEPIVADGHPRPAPRERASHRAPGRAHAPRRRCSTRRS